MIAAVRPRSATGPHPDPSTTPTAGVPAQRSCTVRAASSTCSFLDSSARIMAGPASRREDDFPDDLAFVSERALGLPVEHHTDPAGVAKRQRDPILGLPPDAFAWIQQRFLEGGTVDLHLDPAPLDGLDVHDQLLPVVRGDSFERQG